MIRAWEEARRIWFGEDERLAEIERIERGASVERNEKGEENTNDVLRGVGLGRGDTDLGTGVDVDTAVRLSGDGRSDGVDDSEL
jgi:hypothetical protein